MGELEEQKDLYYLAVKVFLRDKNKLLIIHDIYGEWDLPGGRLRKNEFDSPFEEVVERKIREEIGSEVQYKLQGPNNIYFRVQRKEMDIQKIVRIFGIGFDATYLGGDIKLGDIHDKMEWVEVDSFNPKNYFKGGWLKGVQEYFTR